MQGFLARYSAMRDCASRSKDYTCGPAHAKNKRKPPQRMGRHTRCSFMLKIDPEPYLLGRNGWLEKLKTRPGPWRLCSYEYYTTGCFNRKRQKNNWNRRCRGFLDKISKNSKKGRQNPFWPLLILAVSSWV